MARALLATFAAGAGAIGAAAVPVAAVDDTAPTAPTGPYKVLKKTYTYDAMDSTNRNIDVVYPAVNASTPAKFPLISFAHGLSGQGYASYHAVMDEVASWGYVIAAPLACRFGCLGDCKSESGGSPPCFMHYYLQQLHVFDFAKTAAAAELPIDAAAGVGVSGHSMGGQATVFSSAYNTSAGIKAAVMHHAFTHTYPAPQVPFLAFTGTADTTASSKMTESFYNAAGGAKAKGMRNKKGVTHSGEMGDQKVAMYTVAWFKIFLDKTPQALGMDFDALIFGKGADSFCSDGEMEECFVNRG